MNESWNLHRKLWSLIWKWKYSIWNKFVLASEYSLRQTTDLSDEQAFGFSVCYYRPFFFLFFTYIRFFCMLIEVSSRICFYHVAKCFQDDSQIQDQMLQHLQCRHCIIWIWSVFLHSEVSATDQHMHQSVAESLSLS